MTLGTLLSVTSSVVCFYEILNHQCLLVILICEENRLSSGSTVGRKYSSTAEFLHPYNLQLANGITVSLFDLIRPLKTTGFA